jgi:beta-lactamase regulating signal transducer with metallopeptidase domain/DUF4097 and DUF4098 domain-containing protein YvlB
MNATLLHAFPAGTALLLLLLLLKVTILWSLAGLVTTLLRGRSAATRHLVWLAALIGAIALVPLVALAPRLPVRLPEAAGHVVPRLALLAPAPATAPLPVPTPETREAEREGAAERPATMPVRRPLPSFAAMLGLAWLAGALAIALWSLFGHLGLWALLRSSIPVEPPAWARHYGLEPPARGAAGRVRLALSSVVGTPLTWGWLKPVVLLPSRASAWPLERRRAALLHELAHIERRDYVAQLVATLACALYWFHPLAWWAAARLRSESEHACDDRVLAAGTPAPSYATDLLAVAHGARGPGGSRLVAIGMARRTHLEGRLLAVLDETRRRGALKARAGVATLAVTLLALVPFAGLEPRLNAAPPDPVAQAAPVLEFEATQTQTHTASSTTVNVQSGKATRIEVHSASKAKDKDDGPPDHTMENTMPAKPGGRLKLDLDTGGSVSIRGWDRNEVSVRVELAGSNWEDTQVEIAPESFGVGVHAVPTGHFSNYSTSHRFEIRVPQRYNVRLQSAGGSLTIVGVEGTFDGNTGGGELVLQNARGRASLNTGGGDIDVSDCDLSGSVSTGGGSVRLSRVKGGLRGSSGSGPVIYSEADPDNEDAGTGDLTNVTIDDDNIKVGTKTAGFLHIERAGGTVDLDDVPQGADIQTGGGEIVIRKGSGKIDARTGGGDITIGPIAGSVSASTGAGDVTVRLASVGGREQRVKVWSGTGRVVVELPADLNARFEVETAYTDSFGRAAKITSAWPLDRAPVTDWDASMGTPRRHVRARGTAGRGDGLVYITTVNGDIELRRAGGGTR